MEWMLRILFVSPDKERNPVAVRLMRRPPPIIVQTTMRLMLVFGAALLLALTGMSLALAGQLNAAFLFNLQLWLGLAALLVPVTVALVTAAFIAQDVNSPGFDLIRLTNLTPRFMMQAYMLAGAYQARHFIRAALTLVVALTLCPPLSLPLITALGRSRFASDLFLVVAWWGLSLLVGAGLLQFNLLAVALGIRLGVASWSSGSLTLLILLAGGGMLALLIGLLCALPAMLLFLGIGFVLLSCGWPLYLLLMPYWAARQMIQAAGYALARRMA